MHTLRDVVEHVSDPVKGSRFVGLAGPAADPVAAMALVEQARLRWPEASHHCFAWRLADGRHRAHDAGEPGGSAGRPILARIDGAGLVDVVVVVTRWFGGTKLGVGGLIRAYGGCAGETLDRAERTPHVPTLRLRVVFDYADSGLVMGALAARRLTPDQADWGERPALTLRLPSALAPGLREALADGSAGRVQVEERPSEGAD